MAIEFTAQPILPIMEVSFFFYLGVLFILIIPGQVPLPEPYFDLTPIRATHTKITC
jgi:hypothetical protein